MKVWGASFWLPQERLGYVLLAGLIAIAAESRLSRWGLMVDLRRRLGFVPEHFDFEGTWRALGISLVVIWIVLSIIFTIVTRIRIRRENQVRPKR